MEQNELKNIVSHFAIRGTVSDIKPLGAGLINDTLLVTTAEADAPNYVLQRVNTNVLTYGSKMRRTAKAPRTKVLGAYFLPITSSLLPKFAFRIFWEVISNR